MIERATRARNGLGEMIETWTPLATVWAAKSYRRANEAVAADEVAAIRVVRFEIRWSRVLASLNPKDRLILEGVVFDVSEVNEIGRRRGLEIFAIARAD